MKIIDPQLIRNVTIVGEPQETRALIGRLCRRHAGNGSRSAVTVDWVTDHVEHRVRLIELSSHAPIAELERAIRTADGVVVLMNAAATSAPRVEALLRVADDHQVARLCLVGGLDDAAADFGHCVRTVAATRGAVPLTLQIPFGTGAAFRGVIDVVPMWELEPMAAEFFGSHWPIAEQRYHELVDAVLAQDTGRSPTPGAGTMAAHQLYDRIRHLTRIGDVVPVLCDASPHTDDIAALLDAMVRYLPSPMHVCQPEHALD
ncbi:GTP-binding protein [Nocardia africana]|nr:GTP-binding protein [Nocardia africana]MCC3312511.1 GTP-binding protein [Nocardia africana]